MKMKFKTYKIGNRIAIKTMKKTYSKVTYFKVEDGKKVINNIRKNGWVIEFIEV